MKTTKRTTVIRLQTCRKAKQRSNKEFKKIFTYAMISKLNNYLNLLYLLTVKYTRQETKETT